MPGIFSKNEPQCILDENTRVWMEHAFIWLAEQFGPDNIKSKTVVVPNTQFFPIVYNGTKQTLDRTAAIVAKQMDIDIAEVEMHVYYQNAVQSKLTTGDGKSGISAGLYFSKNEATGKYDIFVDERYLSQPEKMVAVIAHEFAHIKLLGNGVLTENDEDLTEITTAVFGLGIFNANASFDFYKTPNGWGYTALGYLKSAEWAYILALYAFYRGENNPPWFQHLNKGIRKDAERSMEFINANTEKIFAEEYKLPSTQENDVLYTGRWTGEYTYGKSYGEKTDGLTQSFTIMMEIKDGALAGTCIDNHMPNEDPAILTGNLDGNQIEFTKQYPFIVEVNDDGKEVVNRNEWSRPIKYYGQFERTAFFGHWEIKTVARDRYGAYEEKTLSGTWTMKRAKKSNG